MHEKFAQFIAQEHLFTHSEEVLLAVSGGRDSVLLSHLMKRDGFRFAIAHCNFRLRPDECYRDQEFVRDLAMRLEVPFVSTAFDTEVYAQAHSMGIEEAARHLRYDFFAQQCAANGYSCVATAHHADDSVETFFLNLLRGTGISGLHGILPVSQWHPADAAVPALRVVHPMLCFSRADIDRFVAQNNIVYVDDSTNQSLKMQRNFLRLQILPQLRQRYPNFLHTMMGNIDRLRDVEQVYQSSVDLLRASLFAPLSSPVPGCDGAGYMLDLPRLPQPRGTLLFELMRRFGFSADDVQAILTSDRAGARFQATSFEAILRSDGKLAITPRNVGSLPQVHFEQMDAAPAILRTADATQVFLDADLLQMPLSVRPWHEGDRFRPFGMKGTRLVSDFLKDLHLTPYERRAVQLLVDADDSVLWIVGLRVAEGFRVTASTKRIIRATVSI